MATTYDPAVKAHALRLVATGMPVRQVAESLEISGSIVWSWVYRARATGKLPIPARETANLPDEANVPIEVAARLRELEARLATLEANQEFLGKVSAFFAKQRQP